MSIPQLSTESVTEMKSLFEGCYSLSVMPPLNTEKVTGIYGLINGCSKIVASPILDARNYKDFIVVGATSLRYLNLINVASDIELASCHNLAVESVAFIINHATDNPLNITLSEALYEKAVKDAAVNAALSSKPNVSLAAYNEDEEEEEEDW